MSQRHTSIQRSVPFSTQCFLVNGLGMQDIFHGSTFLRSNNFICYSYDIHQESVVLYIYLIPRTLHKLWQCIKKVVNKVDRDVMLQIWEECDNHLAIYSVTKGTHMKHF